jgi:hypothetical protein
MPHYFSMCRGMANNAAEMTAVLANPAPVEASWCVLCSHRSGFEGGGVAIGGLTPWWAGPRVPLTRARMWHSGRCGDVLSPYVPTALGCCHRVRRGAAVVGMAAQG